MPILILCGDKEKVEAFVQEYTSMHRQEKVHVYHSAFSEAISEVIERDLSDYHIITSAFYKPERYISYCHAKRFKTGYIVIFVDGENIDPDLEVPRKSTRHDNPLMVLENTGVTAFEEIDRILNNTKMRKSRSNKKVITSDDYMKKVKEMINELQKQYRIESFSEICIETENRMMSVLSIKKFNIDEAAEYYENILKDILFQRGML